MMMMIEQRENERTKETRTRKQEEEERNLSAPLNAVCPTVLSPPPSPRSSSGKLTVSSMNNSWKNANDIDLIKSYYRNTLNVLARYL